MPSSKCWPFGENSQVKVDGMRSALKVSASSRAGIEAAAVHPGPEVGRDGNVRRRRHDAVGERAAGAGDLVQDLAEPHLRGDRLAAVVRQPQLLGNRHGCRGQRRRPAAKNGADATARSRRNDRPRPPMYRTRGPRGCRGRPEPGDLRRRHQAGVVVLVAGERQAAPLDGVGEEEDRAVVAGRRLEGGEEVGRSWPPRFSIKPRELGVAAALDQTGAVALVADLVEQPRPPGRAAPGR